MTRASQSRELYSMTLEQVKDILWISADGSETLIRNLSESHLINIIKHCKEREWAYGEVFIEKMERIALQRGITADRLVPPPLPWLDVDGKWKTYCDRIQAYVEVPNIKGKIFVKAQGNQTGKEG